MSYLRRHKWLGALSLVGLGVAFFAGTAAPEVEPIGPGAVAVLAGETPTGPTATTVDGYMWSVGASGGYAWSPTYTGNDAPPAADLPSVDPISGWGIE